MGNRATIEKVLNEEGYYMSTTSGISMWPMLRDRRDTIMITPPEGRLKKYDVPLYRFGEKYILHRIIDVKEDYYVICGDNCIRKEHVKDEQVIGVLTGFYRKNKPVDMSSLRYRMYVRFWCSIYPIRVFFKKVHGKIARGR